MQLANVTRSGFKLETVQVYDPKDYGAGIFSLSKNDIQLLYEYDRWANNRVLQAVSVLNPQQFTRDLARAFRWVETRLYTSLVANGCITYWKEAWPKCFISSSGIENLVYGRR